ncbi:MAG: HAMP domain-containing histidine kinase [Symploca sp. SIO2E9]|nr:HAMP domain-containing histidine kinase [Symploca sp. SIO2E9]
MGEIDLIYLIYLVVGLLVGIGLGLLGSRITNLSKQQEVSKVSTPFMPKETQNGNELHTLEEELKQTQLAYEMAKTMSQFKAGFLARTSHELRAPLSSLMGMHQLILSDLCDSKEEEREFIAQANNSAQKMVKLLDEVITVAKTEHGTSRLEIRPVQLTRVFEDIYRLTHMQAANRNFRLEIVPPDSGIHVLADPRRFRQVLVGIVDSAITQMEDGSIKVSSTNSPSSEEIKILIDIQCSNPLWSEPVDLLHSTPKVHNQTSKNKNTEFSASPGLTLFMANTLVEVMQGRLELIAVPYEEQTGDCTSQKFTRLQCSMPQTTPEALETELVQN